MEIPSVNSVVGQGDTAVIGDTVTEFRGGTRQYYSDWRYRHWIPWWDKAILQWMEIPSLNSMVGQGNTTTVNGDTVIEFHRGTRQHNSEWRYRQWIPWWDKATLQWLEIPSLNSVVGQGNTTVNGDTVSEFRGIVIGDTVTEFRGGTRQYYSEWRYRQWIPWWIPWWDKAILQWMEIPSLNSMV
jgi:hypothetical protein